MTFWKATYNKSTQVVSPVSKYLTWKSNKENITWLLFLEGMLSKSEWATKAEYERQIKEMKDWQLYYFSGWDKEKWEKIKVLPNEFILLDQVSCVKWWDAKNNCEVYSNEVKFLNEAPLIARSHKWGEWINSLYNKDTREEFRNKWLKFTKGLLVQEWDIIIEYYLQGKAIQKFNEDIEAIDTENYKVKFDGAELQSNWQNSYYIPHFVQWEKITDAEREQAMSSVELLEDYHRSKYDN